MLGRVCQSAHSSYTTVKCRIRPASITGWRTGGAGFNYLQSVTPRLALGGEAFWLGQQRKSGTGFAGRYQSADYVATAQLASTGLVSLTFTQRISEKVSACRAGSVEGQRGWQRTSLPACYAATCCLPGYGNNGLFSDAELRLAAPFSGDM